MQLKTLMLECLTNDLGCKPESNDPVRLNALKNELLKIAAKNDNYEYETSILEFYRSRFSLFKGLPKVIIRGSGWDLRLFQRAYQILSFIVKVEENSSTRAKEEYVKKLLENEARTRSWTPPGAKSIWKFKENRVESQTDRDRDLYELICLVSRDCSAYVDCAADSISKRIRDASGSVFEHLGRVERLKVTTTYSSVNELVGFEGLFPAAIDHGHHEWTGFLRNLEVTYEQSRKTRVCRLALVPKDCRGPRGVFVQPSVLLKAQLAIKDLLSSDLIRSPLRHMHDPESQEKSRVFVRENVAYRKIATIDLSDASDCVPVNIIRDMFGKGLAEALLAVRPTHLTIPRDIDGGYLGNLRDIRILGEPSCKIWGATRRSLIDLLKEKIRKDIPKVDPEDGSIELAMYATQGAATCFEVLTRLVCSCGLASILHDLGYDARILVNQNSLEERRALYERVLSENETPVVGDDLAIKERYAPTAVRALEICNLKVNNNKTFVGTYIGESCGEDNYFGRSMTAVKAKKIPSFIKVSVHREDDGFIKISDIVLSDENYVIGLVDLHNRLIDKYGFYGVSRTVRFIRDVVRHSGISVMYATDPSLCGVALKATSWEEAVKTNARLGVKTKWSNDLQCVLIRTVRLVPEEDTTDIQDWWRYNQSCRRLTKTYAGFPNDADLFKRSSKLDRWEETESIRKDSQMKASWVPYIDLETCQYVREVEQKLYNALRSAQGVHALLHGE